MQTFHQFRCPFGAARSFNSIQLKRTHEIQFYDDVNCVATCRPYPPPIGIYWSVLIRCHRWHRLDWMQTNSRMAWIVHTRCPPNDKIPCARIKCVLFRGKIERRQSSPTDRHITHYEIHDNNNILFITISYSSTRRCDSCDGWLGDSVLCVHSIFRCDQRRWCTTQFIVRQNRYKNVNANEHDEM